MSKKFVIIGFIAGFFTPILLFMGIAFIKFSGDDLIIMDENRHSSPNIQLADIKAVDLSNKPIHILDYTDDIILVDFWATWCSPCTAQFSYYDKLHRSGRVHVVAISDQKIETIKRFKQKKPYVFTFLKSLSKLQDYKIEAIPLTFLFYKENGTYTKIENPDSTKLNSILKRFDISQSKKD